jgi:hypothetical protein
MKLPTGWADMDPKAWNPDMDVKTSVGHWHGRPGSELMAAGWLARRSRCFCRWALYPRRTSRTRWTMGLNGLGLKGVDRYFTFPQGDAAKQPIKLPPPNQKPGTRPADLDGAGADQGSGQGAGRSRSRRRPRQTDQHLNQLELQRHTMENQQADGAGGVQGPYGYRCRIGCRPYQGSGPDRGGAGYGVHERWRGR